MQILNDNSFLRTATARIHDAKKTVYISTFKTEINKKSSSKPLKSFFEMLATKKAAGVDVRLITNKQGEQGYVPHTNAYVTNYLKKNGVAVRHLRNSRICHAKLIIVDDEFAIFGSHNLSLKSCASNFEISYLTTEKHTVAELVALYIKVWYDAKDS